MANYSFWTKDRKDHPFYVKGNAKQSPYSEREAATVNLAHHLGLSDYFPHAALVDHNGPKAVIQGILDLKRPATGVVHQAQIQRQDLSDIQKLALFDHIIMNTDRHGRNYGFRPDGKILMFDHGFAFGPKDYEAVSPSSPNQIIMPHYANPIQDQTITPETREWAKSLDSQKMADLLDKHGVFHDDAHKQNFINHVEITKSRLINPKIRIADFFFQDRFYH